MNTGVIGYVPTAAVASTLVDPGNKLSNYSVTINNGVLTINPAALTVTITNATRVYGNANPTFNGSITGLKNGDNITATYTSVDATAAVEYVAVMLSPFFTPTTVPVSTGLGSPYSRVMLATVTVSGAGTKASAPLETVTF